MILVENYINVCDYISREEVAPFGSTTIAAELLGVSRVAIFKWIKSGKLPAKRWGRNYLIEIKDIANLAGSRPLTEEQKKQVANAVQKAVGEYLEVFRLLGKE